MSTKICLIVPLALLLGGCVTDAASGPNAAVDGSGQRQDRERDKDAGKPRQMCESTSIAGEPKSFCY